MPVPNALAHQAQLRHALLRAGVQPRLTIGAVNDPLEREADAAAERVMRMPEPLDPSPASRKEPRGEGTLIQTKASAATTHASPQLESSLNSLNSGGTPLDTANRTFFEPRFGQDFSRVRLHTDANAAQMAESLNAKAFTLGNDIAFGANQYSGDTSAGRNLLGHELAHVVQQGGVIQRQDAEETVPKTTLQPIAPNEQQQRIIDVARYEAFIRTQEARLRASGAKGEDFLQKATYLAKVKFGQLNPDMEKIAEILTQMAYGLFPDGGVQIMVENPDNSICHSHDGGGYVVSMRPPIILCPGFFDVGRSNEARIRTLVHEMAHISGIHSKNEEYFPVFDCTSSGSFDSADTWANYVNCLNNLPPDEPEKI
jgi:hypothetical protein